MNEETVAIVLAGLALLVYLWFTRGNVQETIATGGSTQPTANTLAAAAAPSDFTEGPSYFIANQPYYFAPPVGNMMQQAVASNTIIATNDDGGCGCG